MPHKKRTLIASLRQTGTQRACLSVFLFPPFIVLAFGLILAFVAIKTGHASSNNISDLSGGPTPIAPIFTPEVQYWSREIQRWAAQTGINSNIAATIMQIESCGNPDAISYAGAAGLFQVMPFHFQFTENAFDPDTNANRGLTYFADSLVASGGDVRLALAGYNGGISVISESETTWADETVRYVYWGSGIYDDAQNNKTKSDRLDEWLTAGGADLCKKADLRLGLHNR